MSLSEYLMKLRQAIKKIENYGFAESIDMRQEIRTGKQAAINCVVSMITGHRSLPSVIYYLDRCLCP